MNRFRAFTLALMASASCVIVLGSATPASAIPSRQEAIAYCAPDEHGIIIEAVLWNDEPDGKHDIRDRVVSASFTERGKEPRDLNVTSLDNIAESGGHEVRFELRLPEQDYVLPGQVRFITMRADGTMREEFVATTEGIPGCHDAVIFPELFMSVSVPTCQQQEVTVSVKAGDGNHETNIQVLKAPNDVLYGGPIDANEHKEFGPITIPLGSSATFVLVEGKVVIKEVLVTAPPEAECNPTTTTQGPTTTTGAPSTTGGFQTSATSLGQLPYTGSDSHGDEVGGAAIAIAAGGLLTWIGRRRRKA